MVFLVKYRGQFSNTSLQDSGDYIVYQHDEVRIPCEKGKVCEQHTKVFRSGNVLGIGSKMFTDNFSDEKIDKIMTVIRKTGIVTKDCTEETSSARNATYVIKWNIQVRRLTYPECGTELQKIESTLF